VIRTANEGVNVTASLSLNLFAAIGVVAALATVCRLFYMVAGSRLVEENTAPGLVPRRENGRRGP